MNQNAVDLVDARKNYGSVEALRGVSFSIDQGEVVAVLGPNGAGKTTCINLMMGLRRPTAGTVRLYGLDPGDRRARSRCGVMLQESGISDILTVRETVNLFRTYYPDPLPVDRAIAMAGLAEQSGVKVVKLSGGQRQRLYYALAVCGDPDTVFLDEPTVGMDVESRRAFHAGIREFAARGKTMLLTTHYLEEADELAQRILVFDRGRLVADASPEQIKSRVAGRRVSFSAQPPLSEADFAGMPVSQLEIGGDRVRLFTNAPEVVLGALFRRDVPIRNLEVVGADLEEAFLSLTGHESTEEPVGAARAEEVS